MADPTDDADDFARKAAGRGSESAAGPSGTGPSRAGLAGEFVAFLKENKKWWLAPIIISVLLLGALVLLGGTAAAPFIYTLF